MRTSTSAREPSSGSELSGSAPQDGLLVDLLATPADVQDRDAARILLTRLQAEHPEIVPVWADNGYGGEELSTWAQDTLGITIKAAPRPIDAKGFVLLPKGSGRRFRSVRPGSAG